MDQTLWSSILHLPRLGDFSVVDLCWSPWEWCYSNTRKKYGTTWTFRIEVFVCNRVVLSRKKRIRGTLPKTNIKPEKSGKSETTFFLGLAYFQVLCYVRFFFGSVYREKNASLLSWLCWWDASSMCSARWPYKDNPKLTDIHWAVIVKQWYYWSFGFACSMPGEVHNIFPQMVFDWSFTMVQPVKGLLKQTKTIVRPGSLPWKVLRKTTSNPNVWIYPQI